LNPCGTIILSHGIAIEISSFKPTHRGKFQKNKVPIKHPAFLLFPQTWEFSLFKFPYKIHRYPTGGFTALRIFWYAKK